MTTKIIPNLWFDHNAKEAVDYYVSVFPDSKLITTAYYPEEGLEDFQKEFAGKELSIDFVISGNNFTAINAGPEFKFSEAVSLAINCKDKYGLSWQVVPENIEELMKKPGGWGTMMKQKKIVISEY